MFKKLVLIAVVLTALLVTAPPAFAETTFCDPPPTQGKPRTIAILCYFDTSYAGTTEMGTKDQPFKDPNRAIAEAQAHDKGGTVYDKQMGNNRYYPHVISPGTGAPISRTILFILLGLASLILVTTGWFLMRRARILPNRA